MMGVFKNLFLLYAAVIMAACNDSDSRQGRSMPGTIYCDYKISGQEGREGVDCLFQFKLGGPNGSTVVLKEPGKITLDEEELEADSARLSGIFYETTRPLNEFKGKHTIIFTDAKQTPHRTEFEFIPFSLAASIPEKVERKPFIIKLKGFPLRETPMRLLLIDTAFSTNDVNELVRVANGELAINQSMLDKLKAGPVSMELIKEEEKPVEKGGKEKGRIFISYGLRREFQLAD